MGDLQCPVRIHLGEPGEDRIAVELDRRAAGAAEVVAEIADLADLHRGEAVVLRLSEDVRRSVAEGLVGDPEAMLLEGDADGWVSGPAPGRAPEG